MAKFTFTPSSVHRLSRKAVLGIAAALAITGATGAAALLAPSNSDPSIPTVSAQTLTAPTPDTMSQEPFDRVVQSTAPEATQQPLQTSSEAAPGASDGPPPRQISRDFDRLTRRAPIATPATPAAPVAQAPAAETPFAQPRGEMVPTAAPGVVQTKKRVSQTPIVAPVKQIVRPRVVHIHTPYCND